jgi:hypothetical protein
MKVGHAMLTLAEVHLDDDAVKACHDWHWGISFLRTCFNYTTVVLEMTLLIPRQRATCISQVEGVIPRFASGGKSKMTGGQSGNSIHSAVYSGSLWR